MRRFEETGFSLAVLAVAALGSSAAFAGDITVPGLPGPGILALVAAGVISAIAVARWRR